MIKKTHTLSFTDAEYAKLGELAKAAKLGRSEYIIDLLMTSKAYFAVSGIFMVLYIITSFGVAAGLPEGVHQVCTLLFAGAAFLGWRKKKQEEGR